VAEAIGDPPGSDESEDDESSALSQPTSLGLSVAPWMLPKSRPTTSAAAAMTAATMPITRSRSRADFIS